MVPVLPALQHSLQMLNAMMDLGVLCGRWPLPPPYEPHTSLYRQAGPRVGRGA